MYRNNYQAWGYSPLEQINKTNVKGLQLVWAPPIWLLIVTDTDDGVR
jgi:glucose dehydrogenase